MANFSRTPGWIPDLLLFHGPRFNGLLCMRIGDSISLVLAPWPALAPILRPGSASPGASGHAHETTSYAPQTAGALSRLLVFPSCLTASFSSRRPGCSLARARVVQLVYFCCCCYNRLIVMSWLGFRSQCMLLRRQDSSSSPISYPIPNNTL